QLAENVDRDQALRLMGALENASEHPIAQAIARAAVEQIGTLPEVEDFAGVEGYGVQGVVEGRAVVAGRTALLEQWGQQLPAALADAKHAAEELGRTAVAVGWDGQAQAVFVVADTVKDSSAEAVTRLRNIGL